MTPSAPPFGTVSSAVMRGPRGKSCGPTGSGSQTLLPKYVQLGRRLAADAELRVEPLGEPRVEREHVVLLRLLQELGLQVL